MSHSFILQFEAQQIPELAGRYPREDDCDALAAGNDIRAGGHTRANLERLFRWKTRGRGISRLRHNTDAEIADAFALALSAETDRAAVAVLTGLRGVRVPVASAILTAIRPLYFTVIDFRALEALGIGGVDITIDFYLDYLHKCREIAQVSKVDLRTLDRALWQWSKERPQISREDCRRQRVGLGQRRRNRR